MCQLAFADNIFPPFDFINGAHLGKDSAVLRRSPSRRTSPVTTSLLSSPKLPPQFLDAPPWGPSPFRWSLFQDTVWKASRRASSPSLTIFFHRLISYLNGQETPLSERAQVPCFLRETHSRIGCWNLIMLGRSRSAL